jgi:hypothetical protein
MSMNGKRTLTTGLTMGLLFTLLASLGLAQEAAPQAPAFKGFTYQGRLLDNGSPADGEYEAIFSLYDVSLNGTPLASINEDLTVSDGLFTVRLGFGSQYFTGDARWLEIALRPTGSADPYTTLNPRQQLTPAPYALALPGLWTQINTTSPNVIGGYKDNNVSPGVGGAVIGGGGAINEAHTVTDSWNTIGGGYGNQTGDGDGDTANSRYATVGGGENNVAAGHGATIGGGGGNETAIYINYATIGGGEDNYVSADHSTIAGGLENTVSGEYSILGGGEGNVVSGDYATVGGGWYNEASADYATIGGGGAHDGDPDHANRVLDEFGTVGGGAYNRAGSADGNPETASYATVGGGWANQASGPKATVGGGENNSAAGENATVGGGNANDASGQWATASGGRYNSAGAQYATAGGGYSNGASAHSATVAGGYNNDASGQYAAVGGGKDNTATNDYAAVGGGQNNDATGQNASVTGGKDNVANGNYATVAGGYSNVASGAYAFVAGGDDLTASGDYAFVGGRWASANVGGCFVWGDSTKHADGYLTPPASNSFAVRSSGGVWFYTSSDLTSGVYVGAGGGAWSSLSDRNLKENLEAVDARAVLDAVAAMPVSTWNYTTEDAAVRHMGPMAQDFYAVFGLGDSERHINSLDADGVALAAIQGLYAENQELQARVEALEGRLSGLEKMGSTSATTKPGGWWLLGGLVVVGGVLVQRRAGGR